jgi:hypothetical protein
MAESPGAIEPERMKNSHALVAGSCDLVRRTKSHIKIAAVAKVKTELNGDSLRSMPIRITVIVSPKSIAEAIAKRATSMVAGKKDDI